MWTSWFLRHIWYDGHSFESDAYVNATDIHVELEKVAEQYLGCEKTILYSSGYALVASVIAAFATRSDFLIM